LNKYTHRAASGPILVVDDDPQNRELIGRVLRKDGWSVVEAENGRVGLQRLAEQRPALVLLDLMMPEMDGFEFLDRLHGRPDTVGLPVVVLTAKELTAEDRRRLNGSVEQIISRHGTAERPAEWLRGWLQGECPARPDPSAMPAGRRNRRRACPKSSSLTTRWTIWSSESATDSAWLRGGDGRQRCRGLVRARAEAPRHHGRQDAGHGRPGRDAAAEGGRDDAPHPVVVLTAQAMPEDATGPWKRGRTNTSRSRWTWPAC
jgi:CheY-like chemotaxis protein